jgi:hypothetical protein
MKPMTPAMLLKALTMFRGFTQTAAEYLRDKERLRYLLAAAVSIAQGSRRQAVERPSTIGAAPESVGERGLYRPLGPQACDHRGGDSVSHQSARCDPGLHSCGRLCG